MIVPRAEIDVKLPRRTIQLFGYLVVFKIAYLGLMSVVLLLWPTPINTGMFLGGMLHTMPNGDLIFASHFRSWDAEHYLILSEYGYKKGIAQCAFYPLWPLLVRWFSVFTGGDHLISGMILTNSLSLAGWFFFFEIVYKRLGDSTAKDSLILLVAFPGSLFFQFVYSESLFFLLLMLLCLGMEQNRFWLALTAAFLLPLTRAVGIFCVFPILWFLFFNAQSSEDAGTIRGSLLRPKAVLEKLNCKSRFGGNGFWLLSAPFYGWVIYFFLMWSWTGNPFEGFKAQQYWYGVESVDNLFNLPKFVIGYLTPSCWHGFIGSVLDRSMFVLLIWCLPIIWRLDKGWFIWAFVLGIVPAMSGTFTSFTRFASVDFPLFVALAVLLRKPRLRRLSWLTLMAFALLHLVLLWRFVNFLWAG